jgi:hypothetical protein
MAAGAEQMADLAAGVDTSHHLSRALDAARRAVYRLSGQSNKVPHEF